MGFLQCFLASQWLLETPFKKNFSYNQLPSDNVFLLYFKHYKTYIFFLFTFRFFINIFNSFLFLPAFILFYCA